MKNHGIWKYPVSGQTHMERDIYIIYIFMYGFIAFMPIFKGGLCILFRFFWIRLRILFGFLLFCCPCCSPSLLFYFFAFLFFGCFALLLCFSASLRFFFFSYFSVFSCFSAVLASLFSACLLCLLFAFPASVPFYVYLFFSFPYSLLFVS